MDSRIDLRELYENTTGLFSYKPVVGDVGLTLEITRDYADKIGAIYNDFVNPEVNIIIMDKDKTQTQVLKGTSICDGCISAYKKIDNIDNPCGIQDILNSIELIQSDYERE